MTEQRRGSLAYQPSSLSQASEPDAFAGTPVASLGSQGGFGQNGDPATIHGDMEGRDAATAGSKQVTPASKKSFLRRMSSRRTIAASSDMVSTARIHGARQGAAFSKLQRFSFRKSFRVSVEDHNKVTSKSQFQRMVQMMGGNIAFACLMILCILEALCSSGLRGWVALWTGAEEGKGLRKNVERWGIFDPLFGFLVIAFAGFLFTFLRVFAIRYACSQVANRTFDHLSSSILRARQSFFDSNNIDYINSILGRYSSILDDLGPESYTQLLFDWISLLVAALAMGFCDLPVGLAGLVCAAILIHNSVHIRRDGAMDWERNLRPALKHHNDMLLRVAKDAYKGAVLIRAGQYEGLFYDLFEVTIDKLERHMLLSSGILCFRELRVRIFGSLVTVICLTVCALRILMIRSGQFGYDRGIGFGGHVMYGQKGGYLNYTPVNEASRIGWELCEAFYFATLLIHAFMTIPQVHDLLDASHRIKRARAIAEGIPDDDNARGEEALVSSHTAMWREKHWPVRGRISFRNVTVRYRADLPPSLENVSFEIEPRSIAALIGRSGSGRTTLLLAMLGIVECERGCVVLGGIEIMQIGYAFARRRVGMVLREPLMLRGTLRANIDVEQAYADVDILNAMAKTGLLQLFMERWRMRQKQNLGLIGEEANETYLNSVLNKQISTPSGVEILDERVRTKYDMENDGIETTLAMRQSVALTRAVLKKSKIIVCHRRRGRAGQRVLRARVLPEGAAVGRGS